MGTEGEFNYTNGALIESSIIEERKDAVCRHEEEHGILYTTTTFGQLILMLEKNALFHNKSNWLYKELFGYMNRMQERIAVNIENLSIYEKEGIDAYREALENLKERNKTYYNYFRKLCCINGRVTSEEDAKKTAEILRTMGRMALNVRVDDIPFENFEDAKDLQRFLGNENNAAKYIPNVRFDILVNLLFRNSGTDQEIHKVYSGTIDEDCFENIEAIHFIAEEKVRKILRGYPLYERLVRRITTVGMMKSEFESENSHYLNIMPMNLETNDELDIVYLEREEFKKRVKEKKYENEMITLQHSLGGFEDIHFITFFDIEEKRNYATAIFDEDTYENMISDFTQHLVFLQTKQFRKMKSKIKGLARKLPIYICLENPISYGMDFISHNFKKGNYTYFKQDNYDVLVIWRRHFVFIVYIVELAQKEIDDIFKRLEITYIQYEDVDLDKLYLEKVAKRCMYNMVLGKKDRESLKNKKLQ